MPRSYLSVHYSPVKAVSRLLQMISAFSSVTLFPSLRTLKGNQKEMIDSLSRNLLKKGYSNTSKTQLYTITEFKFLWAEYPIVI